MDVTGAGDAFWSGFLFAYIKEKPIEDCLKIGCIKTTKRWQITR